MKYLYFFFLYACIGLCCVFAFSKNAFIKSSFTKRSKMPLTCSVDANLPVEMPTPGIIIGGGRIGSFLYEANNRKDIMIPSKKDFIGIDENSSGPIYVATRNDDLENVINKTPIKRRKDLVFLQNGMLDGLLQENGLELNTRAILWFAIDSKGGLPRDFVSLNVSDGLTAVTGNWSEDLAFRLRSAGLKCNILDYESWRVVMFEKLVWICSVMAVGDCNSCVVGDVVKLHKEEVSKLMDELLTAISWETGLEFDCDMIIGKLIEYSEIVGDYPSKVKEYKWRNKYFSDKSEDAQNRGRFNPCPIHKSLMLFLEYRDDEDVLE